MEAAISGPQRKVFTSSCRPVRAAHGDRGIPVRNGKTLPFVVSRSWSAPAGYYPETWYLVDPQSREVLYESETVERPIWGLQSLTEVSDRITDPITLAPGSYLLVFALGGIMGGEFPVEALEVPAEAAA